MRQRRMAGLHPPVTRGGGHAPRAAAFWLAMAVCLRAAAQGGAPVEPRITLALQQTPAVDALRQLFGQARLPYRFEEIQPGQLGGTVTLRIAGVALPNALRTLLRQVTPPLEFRVEPAGYVLSPVPAAPAPPATAGQEALPEMVVQSGSPGPIDGVVFSPNGKWIACWDPSAGGGSVTVWETTTGKMAHSFRGSLTPGAFSPDGRLLLTGVGTHAVLWSLHEGRPEREVQLSMLSPDVWFTPDGRRLFAFNSVN